MVTEKFWLLILLFLIALGPPTASAGTLVVDRSGGEFETISEAVAAAKAGDEILIRPGYYREGEIRVLQPISLVGTGGQVTVESGCEAALRVEASGCTISGLAIRGFDKGVGVELNAPGNLIEACRISNFSAGVVCASPGCQIFESTIEGCTVGVRFQNGSDLPIRSCQGGGRGSEISNCTFSADLGVEMVSSCNNAVVGSIFLTENGIGMSYSRLNRIEGNEISSSVRGIFLEGSEDNLILENDISGSGIAGIVLQSSENNSITDNDLSRSQIGVYLEASGKNFVADSSVRECDLGIGLRASSENRLEGNLLEYNGVAGVRLVGSKNNRISGNVLTENGEGLLFKSGSIENAIEDNEMVRNGRGLTLLGSGLNRLRGNRMELNRFGIRVDREDLSAQDDLPFRQDFDSSNLVDGKPVCYIVDGRDRRLAGDCGFLALVGCENVTAENLVLSNNSAGALIVNSTGTTARNLTLSGNEVGVRMLNTSSCKVEGCNAEGCTVGFGVQASRNDILLGCTALGSSGSGFEIKDSEGFVLRGSNASENRVGISVIDSPSSMILNSELRRNAEEGIRLIRSPRSVLNLNRAIENRRGISASGSDGVMVIRNCLSSNPEAGLSLHQLSAATASGNTAQGNGDGIFLQSVVGGKIEGNNLSGNDRYGLRMSNSREGKVTGNTFVRNGIAGVGLIDCRGCSVYHNNFIENGNSILPQNAVDNGDNDWDAGSGEGGNYWSDHQVSGNPGADPKVVPAKGMDRYPFEDPDGWK